MYKHNYEYAMEKNVIVCVCVCTLYLVYWTISLSDSKLSENLITDEDTQSSTVWQSAIGT